MQDKSSVDKERKCITANMDCMTKCIHEYTQDHNADNLIKAFRNLDEMKEHIGKLQKIIMKEYFEVR